MKSRFTHAIWYIGDDADSSTTIYDASDLEGTGPNVHGMVCRDAVHEDALLIALAPELYRMAQDFIEQVEAYDRLHGPDSCPISPDAAKAAIAQVGE